MTIERIVYGILSIVFTVAWYIPSVYSMYGKPYTFGIMKNIPWYAWIFGAISIIFYVLYLIPEKWYKYLKFWQNKQDVK